jgi:hypothetical protein
MINKPQRARFFGAPTLSWPTDARAAMVSATCNYGLLAVRQMPAFAQDAPAATEQTKAVETLS